MHGAEEVDDAMKVALGRGAPAGDDEGLKDAAGEALDAGGRPSVVAAGRDAHEVGAAHGEPFSPFKGFGGLARRFAPSEQRPQMPAAIRAGEVRFSPSQSVWTVQVGVRENAVWAFDQRERSRAKSVTGCPFAVRR
jgi:hypothetical protein